MKTKVEERFSEFFEKWMCQLDENLQHLRRVSEDYRAKTGVTGWKSSAVFKLVNSIRKNGVSSLSLVELTQEQMRKVEVLRVKIRLEEEKVEREMERQQVAIADRKMGVGKIGGSSEKWGASEAGGRTGASGTKRSNGRTREGDESSKLCKA
ncbi:hypothetical protein GH714_013156 [Hevea brasiliensis]|uniref:Uncharacterized protein n=1 Tax=Hevea brasiliensis TaxID=3981 RepID=A0A6A6LNP8_HEVBR|nr:hypothetical protein GH714_013156 [Hevea brasiliensis]